MNDAEAMAKQPPVAERAMMFELCPSAREWISGGIRWRLWLPSQLSTGEELDAWDVLAEWDALAGRLVREALFGEPNNARKARRDAEAVAAEAERVAVRLGARD